MQTRPRETDASCAGIDPPRVVVLTAAGGAPPSALMRVLGRKGVAASVSGDEPAVMAELAGGPAVAVVLADGDRPERAVTRKELLAAVRRYYPQTGVWQYVQDPAGRPTVRVLVDEPPRPAGQRVAPAVRHPPATRARDEAQDGDETISEEELRMLLDPAPVAQAQRRSGRDPR